jgi:hypothetical protein
MVDPDIEILIKAARARAQVLHTNVVWRGARSVDVELLLALAERLERLAALHDEPPTGRRWNTR